MTRLFPMPSMERNRKALLMATVGCAGQEVGQLYGPTAHE
jgi:hypothetical protein